MKNIRVGDIPLSSPAPKAKAKPFGKVSGVLVALTALVTVWLFYEVGLLKFSHLSAAEKPAAETGVESLQRTVQEREKGVNEKEEAVTRREAAVADKEAALAEQIKSYEKTIHELRQRLDTAEAKPDQHPDEFLSIYEKMEAKRAAKVFEKLDVTVATKFLKKMSSGRAAEILGLMPAEKAKAITERHLSRELAANKDNVSGQ